MKLSQRQRPAIRYFDLTKGHDPPKKKRTAVSSNDGWWKLPSTNSEMRITFNESRDNAECPWLFGEKKPESTIMFWIWWACDWGRPRKPTGWLMAGPSCNQYWFLFNHFSHLRKPTVSSFGAASTYFWRLISIIPTKKKRKHWQNWPISWKAPDYSTYQTPSSTFPRNSKIQINARQVSGASGRSRPKCFQLWSGPGQWVLR